MKTVRPRCKIMKVKLIEVRSLLTMRPIVVNLKKSTHDWWQECAVVFDIKSLRMSKADLKYLRLMLGKTML